MSQPFKDRLFRGYGPLVGFTAAFLAIVLLVPSKAPEEVAGTAGDAESVMGALGEDEIGATEDVAATDTTLAADAGLVDTDGDGVPDSPGGSSAAAKAKAAQAAAAKKGGAAANTGPAKIAGCGDQQVKGDPYSPPCIQFSGGNGGATSKGVTDTEVTVAIRIDGFDSGLVDAITATIGAGNRFPKVTREQVERTITGLTDYFNKRFQFYGRKLKVVIYDGKGNVLDEILSAGQEGAQADALKVAEEIKAFADVSSVTPPYASALASKGVINIGAPYVSRDWLNQRNGMSWTPLTDCTTVVESVSSYYATKMAGGAATNAGGAATGKPRRMAIIAPENPEYQACVNAGVALLERQGKAGDLVARHKYTLSTNPGGDIASILPKLTGDGITTILCGCDPVFLNLMTTKMGNDGYLPEMVVTGVALVDSDLVGQVMDQRVWRNAFGISYAGATQPLQKSLGYRAYKSVRPDEPALGVDLIYNQLYMLAIGVQMAGPNLTPASFAKGMYDYPARSGPFGTWGFAPGDHSTSDDAREVVWNPDANSVQTGTKGAYQDPNGGARFPIGQWPATPARAIGR